MKIDNKSIIIGFFVCLSMLLIMGQKRGNMGDIVVNSIIVEDDGSGGFVRTLNKDNEETGYFGTGKGGEGIALFYNSNEGMVVAIGTAPNENGGALQIFNNSGSGVVLVGVKDNGDGGVSVDNQRGNEIWSQ